MYKKNYNKMSLIKPKTLKVHYCNAYLKIYQHLCPYEKITCPRFHIKTCYFLKYAQREICENVCLQT